MCLRRGRRPGTRMSWREGRGWWSGGAGAGMRRLLTRRFLVVEQPALLSHEEHLPIAWTGCVRGAPPARVPAATARSGWPTDGGQADAARAVGASAARTAAGCGASAVEEALWQHLSAVGAETDNFEWASDLEDGFERVRERAAARPPRLGTVAVPAVLGAVLVVDARTRTSPIRIGAWSVARTRSSPRRCGSRGPRSGAAGGCTARAAPIAAGGRATGRCPTRSASTGSRSPPPTSRRSCAPAGRTREQFPEQPDDGQRLVGQDEGGVTSGSRSCARSSRPATAPPCSNRSPAPGSTGSSASGSPSHRGGGSATAYSSPAPPSTPPTVASTAPTGRPSSGRSGLSYWFWEGLHIPRRIAAKNSERARLQVLVRTPNLERRRLLLDRIGYERFLDITDAELVQQDDYGKLWRTTLSVDGEQLSVVEVVNSTPEPDGSHRRYFLRVPPDTRTARAGRRLDVRLRRRHLVRGRSRILKSACTRILDGTCRIPERNALRAALPAGVRVGTVDKFQGQEAPVVFYSTTSSSGEEVPRGLEFLFSRNRLNVAISRAQCLAVLVGEPAAARRAHTVGRPDASGERALPAGRGRRA